MLLDRDPRCRTCRYALGGVASHSLTCTLIEHECPGLCTAYEREAGADLPDDEDFPLRQTSPKVLTTPFRTSREEKRYLRELRNQ